MARAPIGLCVTRQSRERGIDVQAAGNRSMENDDEKNTDHRVTPV
jgi:hypothetical protein